MPEDEKDRAMAHLAVVRHLREADEAVATAVASVERRDSIDFAMLRALEALAKLGTAVAMLGVEVFRDGGDVPPRDELGWPVG